VLAIAGHCFSSDLNFDGECLQRSDENVILFKQVSLQGQQNMKRLPQIGRIFFAIGLLGIGIEHFIYDDFMLGRAPAWPPSVGGQKVWAYFTGTIVILAGGLIITGWYGRVASVVTALLVVVWAALRHIPVIAADAFLSGAWTAAGKAFVFTGGALVIASTFPKVAVPGALTRLVNNDHAFIITGRVCLGLFLVMTGIQHFMYVPFVASLIPSWFPGDAIVWTYVAGVALIAGGVGLFIPRVSSLAAFLSGLMIFLWVLFIHIPRIMVSVSDNIAVFEALAFSGIAFVLMRSVNTSRATG
jgi:uncharacterized membrane protein